jgi:hypothetical protein
MLKHSHHCRVASVLLSNAAVERIPMLQDAILILLIVVTIPLGAIVIVRGIAKTKRQRRPVQNFRLK